MLCCTGPWCDPASAYHEETGVTPYPGMRRPQNTVASTPIMVNATVPVGMEPGEKLQVTAPDGSRSVMATIPEGMAPGQTFIVSFPPVGVSDSFNQGITAADDDKGNCPGPLSTPIAASIAPVQQQSVPFSLALDGSPKTFSTDLPEYKSSSSYNNSRNRKSSDQKLLQVTVPAGTPVGSSLYVQVPGENRTIKATVPPGVTQFHVAYQPRSEATAPAISSSSPASAPMPVNPVPTTHHGSGQRLLLVRVPQGTAPGSILHVEVPDEPGRILAVQVPFNVTEFQVAYGPRTSPASAGLPRNNVTTSRSSRAHENGGGTGDDMTGSSMVPLIGTAAVGAAAGIAMFDHFAH